MIERKTTKYLLELLKQFPAVAILGPRQVGKTTLAKLIRTRITKKSIYLDLESRTDRAKLIEPEIYLKRHSDKLVIIDEIQLMPELFSLTRVLIDQRRIAARFLFLGSSSTNLWKGLSESLTGRIAYMELTPFNLSEVSNKYTLENHWLRGGFPKSLLAKNDIASFRWLNFAILTYTEKDFTMLGLDAAQSTIYNFWKMLGHHHGGIWNASVFAESLGVSRVTIQKYLDFMAGAFLIRKLPPFFVNIKKRILKSPKIYIRDSGFLHRLNDVINFDQLQGNVLIGHSWEGYVIEQISQQFKDIWNLYYYRTHQGSEIDLVITKGMIPKTSIEIKYTSSPSLSKGNAVAIEDLKTKNNYIITPYSDDYQIRKDVTVCNLETFLRKYLHKH